jgi:hypothetical protein
MKINFYPLDYVDEFGNYTDYNFDDKYEMTVDKFGFLAYTVKLKEEIVAQINNLIYYEHNAGVYLEISVNHDTKIIKRITITPTELISKEPNFSMTKIPEMMKIPEMSKPRELNIANIQQIALIDLDKDIEFKEENLHFEYFNIGADLICLNSGSPSNLYSYYVCDVARLLVGENEKIYGVMFLNYENAVLLPHP